MALALHAAVAAGLWHGWDPDPRDSMLIKPNIIKATLRVIELPKRMRTTEIRRPPAPKVVPEAIVPPAKPKMVEVPTEPPEDPERLRREREEQRREQERQQRLRRLEEIAFKQALEIEAYDLSEAGEETEAARYIDGIYTAIVASWSRPPSARNDMQARLIVELIPTGEVASVTVRESSGNTAFDRSAEAAVRKARKFEVPQANALFEKHFRKFTLLFKPEDLLR